MSENGKKKLTNHAWMLVLATAVFALIPKLLFQGQRGFWLDEYYTLHAVLLPMDEMIGNRIQAGHSPLPFLYAKLWMALLGDSELALRMSSIVATVLALIATAAITARLELQRILPCLLPLLLLHPYWHLIGTEFRYTMPLVALGACWFWATLAWLQDPQPRHFLAALIAGAASLWWHGSAQFIGFAILGMTVSHCLYNRANLRSHLIANTPLLLSFFSSIPLFLLIAEGSKGSASSPSGFPSPEAVISNQLKTFFGDQNLIQSFTGSKLIGDVVSVLVTILYAAAVLLLVQHYRRNRAQIALQFPFYIGALICLPLGVMLWSVLRNNILGPERYVAFSSVPMAILFACALVYTTQIKRLPRLVYQSTFVGILLLSSALHYSNQGEWHREAIQWLRENRLASEPIITRGRGMNLEALAYHGVPEGVYMDGVPSDGSDLSALDLLTRTAMQKADLGYLLLYRSGRLNHEPWLESLLQRGEFLSIRTWRPTHEVLLIALAKTPTGVNRLQSLPELPNPRVTDNPVRKDPNRRVGKVERESLNIEDLKSMNSEPEN